MDSTIDCPNCSGSAIFLEGDAHAGVCSMVAGVYKWVCQEKDCHYLFETDLEGVLMPSYRG